MKTERVGLAELKVPVVAGEIARLLNCPSIVVSNFWGLFTVQRSFYTYAIKIDITERIIKSNTIK